MSLEIEHTPKNLNSGPPTQAALFYRRILGRRSQEDLKILAHIKRFMERLQGDSAFRKALSANSDTPEVVTQEYGIEVDPKKMLPLWHTAYLKYRGRPECSQWPLAEIWDEYMKEMFHHRDLLRDLGNMEIIQPRFHKWRQQQMRRCSYDLGGTAPVLTHPILAFELSEGCTVGCWFCGLAASKYQGYYAYTDANAQLWRSIIVVATELFGDAAQTGFCYWATDPCDNPDYDKFIYDYYTITGALPQTTTAAPLRDPALTRRILDLFSRAHTVTNRFSVLTTKQLDRIHSTFTPEELMGVELVMQQKGALTMKAHAGRTRERVAKRQVSGAESSGPVGEHTTIACVSGFLINMVQRNIQLITPVPASERWPRGYRVVGEKSFQSASDFRSGIESLIEEKMNVDVQKEGPLRFRDGLSCEADDGLITVRSRKTVFTLPETVAGVPVGKMIISGDAKTVDLVKMSDGGPGLLEILDLVDQLHETGLLEDGA